MASPFRASARLIPAALIALYVGQCLWFAQTQSLTYDEPAHIAAGLNAWRQGSFDAWNDQPPLGRLIVSLPLLGRTWQLRQLAEPLPGNFWTFTIEPSAERLARRARVANIALGVLLAVLLWTTAKGMFSEGGANLALALFALSPALVAHFSVATVDGTATLTFFAMVIALLRWRRHASWTATVILGLAIGAFVGAKFSAPPLAAILLATAFVGGGVGDGRWSGRLARCAAAAAVALFVIWALYLFHIGPLTLRSGRFDTPNRTPGVVVLPIGSRLDVTATVPAPEYWTGLRGVMTHVVRGQPSFLLGRVRQRGGWWFYYPIVAALKWPLAVWTLAFIGIAAAFRGMPATRAELAVVLLFPAIFFGFALTSSLDVGDRYILPIYPFLLLFAAAAWRPASGRRAAVAALAFVLAAQAVDSLRYAPDYLSYFNVLVPADRTAHVLTDSNLDWGQGLIALRAYENAHPDERTSLAYFGGVDPRDYHVRAQVIGEDDRPTGTVVVSATHLSGQYLRNPSAFKWLRDHQLSAVLNHTLYVFQVDE